MTPTATAVYAAILAGLYLYLAVQVIRARRAARVPLGTGASPKVERSMRAHANFAEYAPFALLLIAFVELLDGPSWLVHLLGVTLVVARLVHAFGISREPEDLRYRIRGMAGTFGVIGAASAAIMVLALGRALSAADG